MSPDTRSFVVLPVELTASCARMSLVCVIQKLLCPQRPLRENFPVGLVLLAGSSLIIPLHCKPTERPPLAGKAQLYKINLAPH